MTTTLEKVRKLTAGLRQREQQEALELATQYRQLVRDVTDGKVLDPETVIALLYECGKTAQELEADCVHLTERREKFSQLEAARKLSATISALHAEQLRDLEESEAEHKAWQTKWKSRYEALQEKVRSANTAETQAMLLTEQLQKTAWPELMERLESVRARRQPILSAWQDSRNVLVSGDNPHHRQRMADLQVELDALTAEESSLRQEMLEP